MTASESYKVHKWEIPVVMAFDPGYLLPSAVTMISIMEHGNPDMGYHFYILAEPQDEGMDQGLFQKLADRYPGFSYEYRLLDNAAFRNSSLPIGVDSRLTFARLAAAEILTELDTCLYLDGDLLVRGDVAELYEAAIQEMEAGRCYLMAAPDLSMQNGSGPVYDRFRQAYGRDDLTDYFNAGVMVMNLKKLRKDHMFEQFIKHADRTYVFADQDILNLCCLGNVGMLPVRWNTNPCNIYDECMLENGCTDRDKSDLMNGESSIIHFAGADKPWKCIETVWEHEWYRYACLLPRMSLTEDYLRGLSRMNHFDAYADRTAELSEARRYVLYGYTKTSRKLLDRLQSREIGRPWYFCDADPAKQGQSHQGIPCYAWPQIRDQIGPETVIVLCGQKSWKEIRENLLAEGISPRQMVRYRERDFALVSCGKEFDTGLLMGVFDLFHIGHLKLIRRAKAHCRYLRIGVLSDDLVYEFKKIHPTIPQEERMEILCALRDVDEVVLLTKKEDVSRLNEWKKRPFDCFFSGDDYAGNSYWEWEKKELQKLGADIMFFPYTKERSSTMIRKALRQKSETAKGE